MVVYYKTNIPGYIYSPSVQCDLEIGDTYQFGSSIHYGRHRTGIEIEDKWPLDTSRRLHMG